MKSEFQRMLTQLFRDAAAMFAKIADDAVGRSADVSQWLSPAGPLRVIYIPCSPPSFRSAIPWAKTQFFWSDERHVPPDNPESNYRMAYEAMISKVPVPAENIHRVMAEMPDAGAAAAEATNAL